MSSYVININWGGGNTTGRSNTGATNTATSFLGGAVAADVLSKKYGTTPSFVGNAFIGEGNAEGKVIQYGQPYERNYFLFSKWKQRIRTTTLIEGDTTEQEETETLGTAFYKRNIAYTAAQATRIATAALNSHFQYTSAIASTTTELNTVNDYNNAISAIGTTTSIIAGIGIGAKIGSVAGISGTAIGAAIGGITAITTKAISLATENRVLNYKQSINATSSAYQLAVLGDSTYGRNRQALI